MGFINQETVLSLCTYLITFVYVWKDNKYDVSTPSFGISFGAKLIIWV